MKRNSIINALLVVTIGIGIGNFAAQFIVTNYKPDPIITTAFMGLAGVLAVSKDKKDAGN